MVDSPVTPSKSITDALRAAETDPRPMTTDIDAVALERVACFDIVNRAISTVSYGAGREQMIAAREAIRARGLEDHHLVAALASAKPAQAGEYESLAKRMENSRYVGHEPTRAAAASAIRTLEAERDEARKERNEARAYLKAFVRATIDPEGGPKQDAQLHQANPTLGWVFTLNDTGMGDREILGSQIRRAMEIVGYDKLSIEGPETTLADEHIAAICRAEAAEARALSLETRLAATGEALKPFAEAARIKLCGEWRDDERIARTDASAHITFGHLRAAERAILSTEASHEQR